MHASIVVRRTPESLLRVVSSLHRHRWPVEELVLGPGPSADLQRIFLRLTMDEGGGPRLTRILDQLLDVTEVDLHDHP